MPELRRVPLADIDEPELPVREAMDEGLLADLAEDMRNQGLLQPIGLKIRGDRFEIEFGHRRFMAATMNAWTEILALIFQPGEITEDAAKLGENLFREDMTAAEEAFFIVQLMEKRGYDEEHLCKALRKSPDWIADRLRLLQGDEEVLNALRRRDINFSVARELNKCAKQDTRRYFLHQAIAAQCGARVVGKWVADDKAQPDSPAMPATEPAAPAEYTAAPVAKYDCELCGGDKDPFNLIHVRMHKWEWEKIQQAYLRGPESEAR